jgi:putative ABC transport system ATP-binding protein
VTDATRTERAIELADVVFGYPGGEYTLRVPELCIDRGETVAVTGPSGSGKTTLLHLVAGIALPGAGRIETLGCDLAARSEDARRAFRIQNLGLVFQEFELLDHLSVLDNILLPYRLDPALRLDGAARSRADDLAQRVGLADKLGRLTDRLSHGERQRVAIARALVVEPVLVLADEPTGNLDPDNKLKVVEILLEDSRRRGTTLVTVTHDHALLDRFERSVDLLTLTGSGVEVSA